MKPLLTIVVCTYNRADLLKICLDSLVAQELDQDFEVIVVDNNSSDYTAEVVLAFTQKSNYFRYIFEPQQGLSYARNRGAAEAGADLVAYIDDDARAWPDWAQSIVAFFEQHSKVAAVGGPYLSYCTAAIPDWFPREYGTWSLGSKSRALGEGEWINGTNMIYRRDVLSMMGAFDTSIGMRGEELSYGEETHLLRRMKSAGHLIYYHPDIVVEHAILPHKLSLGWLLQSCYANGYDGVQTLGYQGRWMLYLSKMPLHMGLALFRFIFTCEPFMRARIYRALGPLLWRLGFLARLWAH
ncbi:MAG: hypothetical protein A3F78_16565 [Burkholderiales bacterium RIFCSPLOWO2_12_FULL_61_40]|nr:MAG: hypothetical protein A3F78_16565 [Burkholderiales bacterium RIFCSPLOWO2_12_FULL_61_40]